MLWTAAELNQKEASLQPIFGAEVSGINVLSMGDDPLPVVLLFTEAAHDGPS